jgi:hypothetical protein
MERAQFLSRRGGSGPRAHRTLAIVVLLALASACSDAPDEAGSTSPVPFGLAAVTDLTTIAELRPPGVNVGQISSYDRTGGNADLGLGPESSTLLAAFGVPPGVLDNSFLYRDGERYVIFDETGPGVVARIWMTGLDGLFLGELQRHRVRGRRRPSPRFVALRSSVRRRDAPSPPLAGDSSVSSGGYYSVPVTSPAPAHHHGVRTAPAADAGRTCRWTPPSRASAPARRGAIATSPRRSRSGRASQISTRPRSR